MVTGKVDFKAYTKGLALPVSGEYLTTTKCCHIFPDSLGKITVDATTGKEYEVASVWAIVTRFGCEDIRAELGSALEEANLHRLSNILTLDSFIHELFDELSIWFEAVNDKSGGQHRGLSEDEDRLHKWVRGCAGCWARTSRLHWEPYKPYPGLRYGAAE
ncbi:hypothetical protein TRAPUB_6513 [Trametes pubescens]|uniref:HNH nuclease domain-containing protein n=1 Tax=Trametes pubescens TaxID=154538 RepID=A0A1M2V5M0_TRAPU|nr:hypothetical protein TRAPUB_6513 [Trametes pubescens]